MKKNLVGQELVGVEVKVVKNQITGCLRHYFEIGEIVKCIRIFKATKTGLFVNKHGIIQQLFLTDIELITSSCEEEKNATKKTIEDLKKEIAKKTAQINVLKDKIKSATNHLENLKIKKIKSTIAKTKITFKELLEKAKTERIAIHTPTERQAKALLKALDKKGYRWIEGEKLTTETQYEVEEENTCYNFELNKKIMYSPLSFYQDEGYTIIKFEDIEWKGDWYVLL